MSDLSDFGILYSQDILITLIGTLALVIFSWFLSLRKGRVHGLYRLVSFASLFFMSLSGRVAYLPGIEKGFPSVVFLLASSSIVIALTAVYTLYTYGNPDNGMEETTQIVQQGIYRYIRHPMYLSLMLLGTALFIRSISMFNFFLFSVNFGSSLYAALVEEGEMIALFGESYNLYMKKTARFIPFLV